MVGIGVGLGVMVGVIMENDARGRMLENVSNCGVLRGSGDFFVKIQKLNTPSTMRNSPKTIYLSIQIV